MPRSPRDRLLRFALTLPDAWEDSPWGGSVAKVRKKIFAFLGTPDGAYGIGVKLVDSHPAALAVPGAAPSGYGLGKAGWVSVPIVGRDVPPVEVLEDWIEESYRQVALKRLVRLLDAERPGV